MQLLVYKTCLDSSNQHIWLLHVLLKACLAQHSQNSTRAVKSCCCVFYRFLCGTSNDVLAIDINLFALLDLT